MNIIGWHSIVHTNFWGETIKTLYPPSLSKAGALTLESHIALKACGVPLLVLRFFYDTTIGFLWDFHGNSLDFLWDFTGMSMRYTLDFYGFCMRFPWNFYRISMVFLWGLLLTSLGFFKRLQTDSRFKIIKTSLNP